MVSVSVKQGTDTSWQDAWGDQDHHTTVKGQSMMKQERKPVEQAPAVTDILENPAPAVHLAAVPARVGIRAAPFPSAEGILPGEAAS
jgi:hypothetical protein